MKRYDKHTSEWRDERRNWAVDFDRCWICGATEYQGFPLETHEMERRSQAPTRCMHVCNYFRTCKKCHMDDLAAKPHAKQLAYKQIKAPGNYNLMDWLRLKDLDLRAPNQVTQEEVDEWIQTLSTSH